ncbi:MULTISPECIES: Crp/Fnr family transcriptional regulator [Alphaproteobacteria]|uniref:Crp/Fnr family transcriptional regulator n=2 Tax=Alphaproteobacteria TaxID=28211 RepID=A0A512HEP9_9HYPH|nr:MULTISPECIES: Crp/Fnr family transcriptional regulator [Alphaproteobacteria]GEO83936.1 Crp/Fnr family transcriptional regulator [Ciceribacter naphthalenivorans]GLR21186.1 Crp/Fnr family transcriptional regulator [Ciceribacter naphthalenivorans]GLT04042.1 Crp/Fnr family transcriptional regulator [Sphingomonas psychrolutea]
MAVWIEQAPFLAELNREARAHLDGLRPQHIPDRTTLFRPGDQAEVFVILLSGRIGVYLTGRGGRELLLYAVTPGETCVQTTLGVLGGAAYTGEAIAEGDLVAVMVPRSLFEDLMANSAPFRTFVFRAFAARLSDLMFVLEQVAFVKVEKRLAHALIERAAGGDLIEATHQELAAVIGTAREVVSRRLEALASKGIVANERGVIRLLDAAELARMAKSPKA